MAVTPPATVAAAYDATGGAWQLGPGRVYDRLAEALVSRCPDSVAGRTVLDLGAGTGAASRAAVAAGARAVVAVDVAPGMLAHDREHRPPAVVGDATALPFRDRSFDAVIAAFSLNHLSDPAGALAEVARVVTPGGALAASAYAADDGHPVKEAVDGACRARGWEPPPWYAEVREQAIPRLATREAAAHAAAGLPGAVVDEMRIAFPDLMADDLVAWRLGMAQVAGFVATLDPAARRDLVEDSLRRVGAAPPTLVRSCITIAWVRPR